jgi:hypothetical protein
MHTKKKILNSSIKIVPLKKQTFAERIKRRVLKMHLYTVQYCISFNVQYTCMYEECRKEMNVVYTLVYKYVPRPTEVMI